MNTRKVLLVAIALVLVACGGNARTSPSAAAAPVDTPATAAPETTRGDSTTAADQTTPTVADDAPAVDTEPTVTTEAPTATTTTAATTTTVAEPAPEPAEDTGGTPANAEDMTTQAACEAAGGTWDTGASTCDPAANIGTPAAGTTQPDETDTAAAPEDEDEDEVGDDTNGTSEPVTLPVRLVVYEGITSEERCLVAGGDWNGTQCIATVHENPEHAAQELTFWHPTLMDDAYEAVNPATVESDHSDSHSLGGPWGFYNYHVFYHYNEIDDPQFQYEIMQQTAKYAVRGVFQYLTDWVWFPHRYDISWTDNAGVLTVTGTYPLGEQRTLTVRTDPAQRTGTPDIELPLPLPPPTRPTTPFANPVWEFAHLADELGRDCPPVEEIWDGYGAEVTDPCTLQAVETAVNYMWTGDPYWRQAAIRDGQAMAEFLHEIDVIEDPWLKARLGYHSRIHGFTHTRDVYWAGHFPAASMIHVEWYPSYTDREFTPEEQAAKVRFYRWLQSRGYDVSPEWLDADEHTLGVIGWHWNEALIVRTADGTWRVSYRAVCYRFQFLTLEKRLLCPDDPNPHFPDSVWYDAGLHPPSHKFYYQDERNYELSPFHQDKVSHRRSGEYVGVPPS